MKSYKRERTVKNIIYHIFTLIFALIMIYPLLWMVLGAFKPTVEITQQAENLLPTSWQLTNFASGWKGFGGYTFGTFFKNSFIIAGVSTLGAVISSAIVAYGFARCEYRGRGLWFSCMLLAMMLPFQMIMIPQYILFNKIGWVGSYLPIIVPHWLGQGFFIFLNVQFIKGIPRDLDDAATIDGCSIYGIFPRIILPLIKPSLVTSAIFSFM